MNNKSGPFLRYSNDPNNLGHPIFYLVEEKCICADCCNSAWKRKDERFVQSSQNKTDEKEYNEKITEKINWEDPFLYCTICLTHISAVFIDINQPFYSK